MKKLIRQISNLFKPQLKFTDLIYIKRGLLSEAQCNRLIKEAEERAGDSVYEHSTNAITGVIEKSSFECVELTPPSDNFDLIHQATKQMIKEWVPYLDSFKAFNLPVYTQNLNYSHSHRLLKYKVGSKIHPHTDWNHLAFASCTVNLNDNYEGGELVFFNGLHSVTLGRGDAVIWPADCFWVHEVLPVTRGVRYCTNSFILARSNYYTTGLRNLIARAPMELNDYQYFEGSQPAVEQAPAKE